MQLLTQKPFHTFNTFNSSTNNNWVKNTCNFVVDLKSKTNVTEELVLFMVFNATFNNISAI
jgi:hypothetical protein